MGHPLGKAAGAIVQGSAVCIAAAGSMECWGQGDVLAFWSMPGKGPVASVTVRTDLLPAALVVGTAATVTGRRVALAEGDTRCCLLRARELLEKKTASVGG